MKKRLLSTLVGVLLLAPSMSMAADIDMSQIKCKDFLANTEDIQGTLMWLDGYLSQKSGNTVMNMEWMQKLGEHVGKFCKENPEANVIDGIQSGN